MTTPPSLVADSASCTPSASRWLPPMDSVDHLWRAGPIALPGSGRVVWWTGRVAIGLRYEGPRHAMPARGDAVQWIAA